MPLSTRRDEILDRSLQKIGGKGLFIKELEVAMQNGIADLAVHSMKDLPAELPPGFCLASVLARASHADALVTRNNERLADLQHGARIGSSSLRRQAQLKMLRPDLVIEPLRGNVNTRLAKLDAGEFDAIVLAAAGLERLGLATRIGETFSPEQMLPAAAQGVLGVECLADRTALRNVLTQLDDRDAIRTTAAERAIARQLQASCQSPVAAHAKLDGNELTVTALVAHPNGQQHLRACISGAADEAESLGERLARQLLQQGAAELLRSIETDSG